MPFVVFDPTSRLISGGYRLSTEATAAAAADADLAADTTDRALPTDFTPGRWYFTTASEIVPELPVPTASIVAERRAVHKQLLRGLEGISGLAAWASQNDTGGDQNVTGDFSGPQRAKYYTRWVEMQARFGSVDSNLSNDANWAVLLAEASIPGRFWYVHYRLFLPAAPAPDGHDWARWLFSDTRTTWVFYQTTGPMMGATATTPNSYIGEARGLLNAGADFDWVTYLTE